MIINYGREFMGTRITGEMRSLLTFYLIWIFIHHISAHIYIYFCTPNTIYGIITSPFMAAAPHCTALRWVMYEGGQMITTMWISFGTYIGAKMISY
jgi:hypothetical protein